MEFLQDMNNNEEEKWFWTDESEKAWNKFLNFVYHVIFNVMDRKPIDYSHSVEASE